jgi:hypothetical protein
VYWYMAGVLSVRRSGGQQDFLGSEQQRGAQREACPGVRQHLGQARTDPDGGHRTGEQLDQQRPVDVAERGVADAGHDGQRHRVRDVGAHQPGGRQAGVEQQDHRGTQRASPDGAQRHQHAQDQAAHQGEGGLALRRDEALQPQADAVPHRAEDDGHGGQHQRDAERDAQHAVSALGDADHVHVGGGGDRGRDAAGEQPAGDAVVDVAVAVVGDRAGDLGQAGEPQVGADGDRFLQAEHRDQQRRHQRAAAHAGETHDQPDAEAGCDGQPVDRETQGVEHVGVPCRASKSGCATLVVVVMPPNDILR